METEPTDGVLAAPVLGRTTLTVTVVRAVWRALSFVVLILVARAMDVDPFGDFIYAVSWLFILQIPATIGVPFASLRYASEYRTTESWGRLRGFLTWSTVVIAVGSIIVSAIFVGWVWLFGDGLSDSLRTTFLVTAMVLPFVGLSDLVFNVMRTRGSLIIPEFLSGSRPLFLGGALVVVWVTGAQLTAPWAMVVHGLFVAAGLGVALVLVSRTFRPELRGVESVYESRAWFRTSLPMFGTATLNAALQRTDIVMVGIFIGTAETGFYRGAVGIAEIAVFGLASVVTVVGPTLAGLNATDDKAQLRSTVRRSAVIGFALTIPAVVGIAVLGGPVLRLFGPEFDVAYRALLILSAAQIVNALAGPVGILLFMVGRERTVTKGFAVWAAVNVLLNLALIPPLGIEGAAIGTAASSAGLYVSLAVASIRGVGVNPTIFRSLDRWAEKVEAEPEA
ncbi:MAG: flippase [Acidimicrobiia bacterium]|nr:flippase [Acidimicrobiia bacterium]MBT8215845.1 flippase [Acidimicrobiia bacterium]NNF11006.1 flippase [Acidimicrobiia bacterium]NNL68848.1 flippase [Acidimicrobiia bacterium]